MPQKIAAFILTKLLRNIKIIYIFEILNQKKFLYICRYLYGSNMNQINKIQVNNENELQQNDQNRFQVCEEVVSALVKQKLPATFNPDTFISKISNAYNITFQEAKTCLKLAIGKLEEAQGDTEKQEDLRYAQSGYFYPNRNTASINQPKKHNDGMDSLSSLGAYNKLMFQIR